MVAVIKSKCYTKISGPQDADGHVQSDFKVLEVVQYSKGTHIYRKVVVVFKNEIKNIF